MLSSSSVVPPGNCGIHGYHGRSACPKCSTSTLPFTPLAQSPPPGPASVSPAEPPEELRELISELPDGTLIEVSVAQVAALLAVGERDKAEIEELRGELAVAYGGPDRDGKQREWFSALDRAKAEAEDLRVAGERDRRQIARLTEFAEWIAAEIKPAKIASSLSADTQLAALWEVVRHHSEAARAVLADEEDARP